MPDPAASRADARECARVRDLPSQQRGHAATWLTLGVVVSGVVFGLGQPNRQRLQPGGRQEVIAADTLQGNRREQLFHGPLRERVCQISATPRERPSAGTAADCPPRGGVR
jgi:hypothetical protein